MLPNRADRGGLRPLVASGLREPHLLADLKIVELTLNHAVAMEVDLTPVGGGNEAMVLGTREAITPCAGVSCTFTVPAILRT